MGHVGGCTEDATRVTPTRHRKQNASSLVGSLFVDLHIALTIDNHGVVETDSGVALPSRGYGPTIAGVDRYCQPPDLKIEIKGMDSVKCLASLVTAAKDDHYVQTRESAHSVVHQRRSIGD